MRKYDSVFCANPRCVLHVRAGDANVEGVGNWAQVANGLIIGRQQVGTIMLCDQCAARIVRAELTAHRDCAA